MKLGTKGKNLSTKVLPSNRKLNDVGKGAPKVGVMKPTKGSSKTSKGMKFKVM